MDDAYAVKTTDDIIQLYGDWAESYDEDLVKGTDYVVHLRVAECLLRHRSQIDGAVLDVGCGTGIVGEALQAGGIEEIDGIDISPQMLAEAGKKKMNDGNPVYRELIQADLTKKLDIPDGRYAGLISAGTFTHAHLGPDTLDELWRIAASGAYCAIGIRSTHFETLDFAEKLSIDVASGTITEPELVEVNMYSDPTKDWEHARDKYLIVACQVV